MYRNLMAEMKRQGMTVDAYAKSIGITQKTARNKLNGITEFTLREVRKTLEMFPQCSWEYLFALHQETA